MQMCSQFILISRICDCRILDYTKPKIRFILNSLFFKTISPHVLCVKISASTRVTIVYPSIIRVLKHKAVRKWTLIKHCHQNAKRRLTSGFYFIKILMVGAMPLISPITKIPLVFPHALQSSTTSIHKILITSHILGN